MEFKSYIPSKHLAGVVKYYWTLEGKLSPAEMYVHRTMANHCPEIIFHYGSEFKEITTRNTIEKTFRTGIHSQTDKIRKFTAKDNCGIFGVVLQPYALALLFRTSAIELKNELVDLESLLGQEGKDISDQILLANGNAQRLLLMNLFLSRQIEEVKHASIIRSVQSICIQHGNVNIQHLSNQISLSQRQFERNFKDLVGFSPKTFSRLVRFKAIVDNYRAENKTMTEMAYDFGYYDQSHFIQDFKQFSGYSPKPYFDGRASDIFYAPR
jgi:AraC-like DNA-binding protein